MKRVPNRAYMTRFFGLQERRHGYAQELQKITSIERNKLIAMKADQMTSCYAAWLAFFENMDAMASANARFSEEIKEVTVEQLERWYTIGCQMVKEQKTEQERVHAAMLKVNISIAKERDSATQALQKLAAKREDATPSSSGGGSAAAPAKASLMDSIFKSNADPQKAFTKSQRKRANRTPQR